MLVTANKCVINALTCFYVRGKKLLTKTIALRVTDIDVMNNKQRTHSLTHVNSRGNT